MSRASRFDDAAPDERAVEICPATKKYITYTHQCLLRHHMTGKIAQYDVKPHSTYPLTPYIGQPGIETNITLAMKGRSWRYSGAVDPGPILGRFTPQTSKEVAVTSSLCRSALNFKVSVSNRDVSDNELNSRFHSGNGNFKPALVPFNCGDKLLPSKKITCPTTVIPVTSAWVNISAQNLLLVSVMSSKM